MWNVDKIDKLQMLQFSVSLLLLFVYFLHLVAINRLLEVSGSIRINIFIPQETFFQEITMKVFPSFSQRTIATILHKIIFGDVSTFCHKFLSQQ